MMTAMPLFICPLCQSPLIIETKQWHCSGDNPQQRQHSFDVARQGYINLLPVQQKKSKQPGDSDASIAARQRFLQAGLYTAFADKLIKSCQHWLASPREPDGQTITADNLPQAKQHGAINTWLDIGCGEGYYTAQFLALRPNTLIAVDISKPAVIATTKHLKYTTTDSNTNIYTIVASASHTPLASGSVDIISSIFSPILPAEFARLLNDNGRLLIAKPAVNHLQELRQGLFETVQAHDSDKFITELAPYMQLDYEQRLTQEIEVNADELADLMTMTPYSYRASPQRRDALMAQCQANGLMSLTIDFVIYGFVKITESAK